MNYTSKRASETELFSVDYANLLRAGETLTSATFSISVKRGTDASPSAMLSGATSINGSVASQKLTGGVAGVVYWVTCSANTSLGQVIVLPEPGTGSLQVVA